MVIKAAEEIGIPLDKRNEAVRKALEEIKRLEREGYSFDLAPASAILILMQHLGIYRERFKVLEWRVLTGPTENSYAIVKVQVGEEERLEAGEGVGPVHAIDVALRRALTISFPQLKDVVLSDYITR